jgi:DNA-binding NtrC family response regulator
MSVPRILRLSAQVHGEETQPRFAITTVSGIAEAASAISQEEFDCILIVGQAPGLNPLETLEALRQIGPNWPVIFWDPEMSATDAVRLIRAGAFQCLGYRDTVEMLYECLESAVEEKRRRANAGKHLRAQEAWRNILVGESPAMERVAETIRLVGPRRCTVLITGETGTGKEMAARALHMASPRSGQPLVAVNCSALPENLLEAELFGHVKGAFTGALSARIGRFEQANKGTLFLDEIGDMPLELQAKLLRALQEREIQRLGSSDTVRVDVRVIAATNVDLMERVRQGRFREDLYYRLNVVPLRMPPLRQRKTDIGLLARHFVTKTCAMEGLPLKRISAEAVGRLQEHPWHGNVRHLQNAVEMAVVMSGDRELLLPSDFGLNGPAPLKLLSGENVVRFDACPETMDFESAVSQFERAMIEKALLKTSGNKTAAAELLGLKRTTLIMKLRNWESCAAVPA